jgi:hypothetical protein
VFVTEEVFENDDDDGEDEDTTVEGVGGGGGAGGGAGRADFADFADFAQVAVSAAAEQAAAPRAIRPQPPEIGRRNNDASVEGSPGSGQNLAPPLPAIVRQRRAIRVRLRDRIAALGTRMVAALLNRGAGWVDLFLLAVAVHSYRGLLLRLRLLTVFRVCFSSSGIVDRRPKICRRRRSRGY